jgi:hypothetical protein
MAYTYPSSRRSSSGDSSWIFIPIIIVVVIFIVSFAMQRIKAGKEAADQKRGEIQVSSVIQEKLLPEEKVLRKVNSGRAEFVATDKRLLRFSSKGCEPLEYSQISAVSYNTSARRKLAVVLIIGFCMLILLGLTIGIWVSAFDSSVRNVSVMDALIITVVCALIGFVGYLGIKHDYGYYQIESDSYEKTNAKSWRLLRPLAFLGTANLTGFIEAVKKQLKS